MKPFVSGIIGALVGAGIGFGAGYCYSKKKQIIKNDRDLAAMEKYLREKYGKTESDILREKAQTPKAEKTEEQPAEGALKLTAEKFKTFDRVTEVKAPIEDYAKKYKITREEDPDPDILPDGGPKDLLDSDEEKQMASEYQCMTIISEDEWNEDGEYDKTEITYWEPDEIFTDSDGVVIPPSVLSPDDVGRPNLGNFGITGEEGILYVRDEDNLSDYKIRLEESSYEG